MAKVDPATYRPLQDGLRAAGHFLDTNDRRLTSLLVVADGIVLTLMPRDLRGVDEALLLTHDDLRGLWNQSRSARVAARVSPNGRPPEEEPAGGRSPMKSAIRPDARCLRSAS